MITPRMPRWQTFTCLIFSCLISPTFAQVWTGAAGDFNFSNPANWQGGVAPANNGTADVSFTGGGPPVNVTVDVNYSINSITTSGASIVGIFGNQFLTLLSNFHASASAVISSTTNFILGGAGVTFDVDAAKRVDAYNVVSGGRLIKAGAGTLSLINSTNTYSGGTTINAGRVEIQSDANLGNSSGGVTFNGTDGTLAIAGSLNSNRAVVFSPGSTGTIEVASGNVFWAGQLTGNGNFTKSGPAALTLSNTNTLSGTTQVLAGTLVINGALPNSPVMVGTGGTLGGSGSIGQPVTALGAITGSQIFSGPVTLSGTLSGSQRFNNSLTINSGGRVFGFSGTFLGPVTVGSGGRFSANGSTTFPNGLSLAANSTLDFRLGSSDTFVITGGTLTGPSSGTITLNFSIDSSYTPGIYTLFDFSSGASTSNFDVSDFVLGSLITASTPANYQLAILGNKLQVFSTAAPIPEPSTWGGLVGLSAIAAAMARRRFISSNQG